MAARVKVAPLYAVTESNAVSSSSESRLEPGDILTPGQLAERLQVGVNWIYEKSRSCGAHGGTPLPCLRMGRYLRFYWPDVCAWMRSGK